MVELRAGPTPFRSDKKSGYIWSQTLRWADRDLVDFVPVAELRVRGPGHGIGDRGSGHRLPPGRSPATWTRSSVTVSGRTPGPWSPRCSASTTPGASG